MTMPDLSELAGKAAVVTGASRGIGAATAHALGRLGVAVTLVARDEAAIADGAAAIVADGGRAKAVRADVSSYPETAAAIARCREAFGAVDILVNNAGVIDPVARLDESDPEAWGRAIDVNVKGVYHGMRAALPIMVEQGGGVVVTISSGAATSPLDGWSHYCASKAAALMLTRAADKEYRDRGIRALGLSPGTVATDMQRVIKASGVNPVSQLDWEAHIPADWAARAVAYLCTEAASDLVGTDLSLKSDEGRRRIGLV